MNIFSKVRALVRSNSPGIGAVNPATWGQFFGSVGGSDAGEIVTDQTTLAVSTCYACIRCLSEATASLPLLLYRKTPQGRIQATDQKLHTLLSIAPNEEMSAFTFVEVMVTSMALCGNSYSEIERNSAGDPIALWPLHPRQTSPIRLEDGTLAFRTTDGGQLRTILAANMLHCPLFPSFDGVCGLSPLELSRQTIGQARAVEKFGSRFFKNYATPAVVVSSPLKIKPEDRLKIRADWEELQTGQNQHRVAILDSDLKIEKLGLSPEDGQYLETRKFLREEIAAIYRVPVHLVGSTEKLTNATAEQLQISFFVDSLRPYLSRIEAEITRKLLVPTFGQSTDLVAEFNASERLRGDVAASTNYYKTGIQFGWLCPNDVRRELNLNEGPAALNVFQVPVNMMNSERLLDPPPKVSRTEEVVTDAT